MIYLKCYGYLGGQLFWVFFRGREWGSRPPDPLGFLRMEAMGVLNLEQSWLALRWCTHTRPTCFIPFQNTIVLPVAHWLALSLLWGLTKVLLHKEHSCNLSKLYWSTWFYRLYKAANVSLTCCMHYAFKALHCLEQHIHVAKICFKYQKNCHICAVWCFFSCIVDAAL